MPFNGFASTAVLIEHQWNVYRFMNRKENVKGAMAYFKVFAEMDEGKAWNAVAWPTCVKMFIVWFIFSTGEYSNLHFMNVVIET